VISRAMERSGGPWTRAANPLLGRGPGRPRARPPVRCISLLTPSAMEPRAKSVVVQLY